MFIKDYLKNNNLQDKVSFSGARCMGQCSNGPNLIINGNHTREVTLASIEKILEKEIGQLLTK